MSDREAASHLGARCRGRRRLRLALGVLLATSLLGAGSCASVKPWERGDLAQRCMTSGLPDQGLQAAYWRKIHESLTAGTLSTTAAGGGCGCSQ
jgi:hypothetical protein